MLISHLDKLPLVQKMRETREFYKEELLSVLRYNHFWTIVPLEIQDVIKHYLPFRDKIINWSDIHTTSNKKLLNVSWDSLLNKNINATFEDIITKERYEIWFEKTLDPTRNNGNTPFRQVIYDNKTYRSVPYNWDCYHHMADQPNLLKELFYPNLPEKIADEIMVDTFIHQEGHDLDEPWLGDHFAYANNPNIDKVKDQAEFFVKLLSHKWHPFIQDELEYYKNLMLRNEWKDTLFGTAEMLQYLKDWVMSRWEDKEKYFNGSWWVSANIWRTSWPKFSDPEKLARITNTNWTSYIPYKEIPAINKFLQKHESHALEVVDRIQRDWAHLLSLNSAISSQEQLDETVTIINWLLETYA